MKLALSFACLLISNAAVFPQKVLGVTKGEIDTLIKDAVLYYKSQAKLNEPFDTGRSNIPIKIEGLNVKVIDEKVWLGEMLKYSESSNLTDGELDLSLEIILKESRAESRLEITGTSQGKQVDQQGEIKTVLTAVGLKTALKSRLTPKSVTVVDEDFAPQIGNISVEITGIDIDGVSKSDLESAVAEGIVGLLRKKVKIILPKFIEQFNKLAGKQSLQEIYNSFRKLVPFMFSYY